MMLSTTFDRSSLFSTQEHNATELYSFGASPLCSFGDGLDLPTLVPVSLGPEQQQEQQVDTPLFEGFPQQPTPNHLMAEQDPATFACLDEADIELSPPPRETDEASINNSTPSAESLELHNAKQVIAGMAHTIETMQARINQLEMTLQQQNITTRPRRLSETSNGSSDDSSVVTTTPPRTSLTPSLSRKANINAERSPSSAFAAPRSEPDVPQTNSFSNATPEMKLVLSGEMETQWYADRSYPAFKLRLVDPSTNEPFVPSQSFKVTVSLLDGFGDECDKLGGNASSHGFTFESDLSTGEVTVDDLRFTQVSSKAGGHYSLVVQPQSDTQEFKISTFSSSRVTVLSYRLFNAPKLDFNKLKPQDSLTKVKGVGSLYAKRFKELGLCTVSDLAQLLTAADQEAGLTRAPCRVVLRAKDTQGRNKKKATQPTPVEMDSGEVVEILRKVRGALTRQKLDELVDKAREVLARHYGEQSTSTANNKISTVTSSPTLTSASTSNPQLKRRRGSLPTVSVGDLPNNIFRTTDSSPVLHQPQELWLQNPIEAKDNRSNTNTNHSKRARFVSAPSNASMSHSRCSSPFEGESMPQQQPSSLAGEGLSAVCPFGEPSLPPLFSAF